MTAIEPGAVLRPGSVGAARVCTLLSVCVGMLLAAGPVLAGPTPPETVYAAATSQTTSGDCAAISPCTLTYALTEVATGGTVEFSGVLTVPTAITVSTDVMIAKARNASTATI